jgi:cytochrome c oxidase subunit 1
MYPEGIARVNAVLVFIGFTATFVPQFIVGFLGMPRRYHYYYFAPEFQPYHIASSMGASILGIAFFTPVVYFVWSLFKGEKASANPWGAHGLEWETTSPPDSHNFHHVPVITDEVYDFPGVEYAHPSHGHKKKKKTAEPVSKEHN